MSDVMAVVDQRYWRWEARDRGKELGPGEVLDWRDYNSKHRLIETYLEPGDRLFLVHAHGERLWLVAVYEQLSYSKSRSGVFRWRARRANRIPIIDITRLRTRLEFHTGKGLTRVKGRLGNSLQTPRMLTDRDVRLIVAALAGHGVELPENRRASIGAEAAEGAKLRREIDTYVRDPGLAIKCLKRDRYACRHCGFAVDRRRFPTLADVLRSRIVHVHHIRPVSVGKRTSRPEDLLTLCPTCHAVVHAIAARTKSTRLDLALLRRHYSAP